MSEKFIPENTWEKYAERTQDIGPRPSLARAIIFVTNKDEALELGSGALNDVRYLISQNFKHITAVDSTPVASEIIGNFPPETVSYVISTFEDFNFDENKYDLINAQYSLPFNRQDTFDKVFKSIVSSLKDGGILTGQFFGVRDEWNVPEHKMNFQTLLTEKQLW